MPIATIASARDEILLHFRTAWDLGTSTRLLYDDKHRDLPENANFARINIKHNLTEQVTVGGRVDQGGGGQRFRRHGVIIVQIFTVSGDGLTVSDVLVQLAIDAFEGERTASDRVEFRNVRANEIGQNGPWFQTNVVAEFVYDRLKTD